MNNVTTREATISFELYKPYEYVPYTKFIVTLAPAAHGFPPVKKEIEGVFQFLLFLLKAFLVYRVPRVLKSPKHTQNQTLKSAWLCCKGNDTTGCLSVALSFAMSLLQLAAHVMLKNEFKHAVTSNEAGMLHDFN